MGAEGGCKVIRFCVQKPTFSVQKRSCYFSIKTIEYVPEEGATCIYMGITSFGV